MGYDYSLEFLDRHREDARMLYTVYQTRQKFFKVFDLASDCARARAVISNVLRSLAIYQPEEFKDVRRKVRTKVDLNEQGKWVLTVYAPQPGEVILGRPPGMSTQSTWIGSQYTPPSVAETGEYQYPITLQADEEAWDKFIYAIHELKPEVKRVFVELGFEIVNFHAFAEHLADWIPRLNGPTTLILERP